jgi:hypothetical protein
MYSRGRGRLMTEGYVGKVGEGFGFGFGRGLEGGGGGRCYDGWEP